MVITSQENGTWFAEQKLPGGEIVIAGADTPTEAMELCYEKVSRKQIKGLCLVCLCVDSHHPNCPEA